MFPIDVNKADFKEIIRIPGIGRQSAMKIIQARKFGPLREHQLRKMGIAFNRAKYFMVYTDAPFSLGFKAPTRIREEILYAKKIIPNQLPLFV
ncbi:helix-hairpin-helix domain-containing protein [Leadbetterella byssophila]|uniref:helix-hairpin-helix domain-containing protein n=1 Tax=Leadbetterella byssophila TaxID=316068 RepID=UPI0039A2B651